MDGEDAEMNGPPLTQSGRESSDSLVNEPLQLIQLPSNITMMTYVPKNIPCQRIRAEIIDKIQRCQDSCKAGVEESFDNFRKEINVLFETDLLEDKELENEQKIIDQASAKYEKIDEICSTADAHALQIKSVLEERIEHDFKEIVGETNYKMELVLCQAKILVSNCKSAYKRRIKEEMNLARTSAELQEAHEKVKPEVILKLKSECPIKGSTQEKYAEELEEWMDEAFIELMEHFELKRKEEETKLSKLKIYAQSFYHGEMRKHCKNEFMHSHQLQKLHEEVKSKILKKAEDEKLSEVQADDLRAYVNGMFAIYEKKNDMGLNSGDLLIPVAPAIGIDLGSKCFCVAVWLNGRVIIIPNNDQGGSLTTPSYVAIAADGTESIGGVPKVEVNGRKLFPAEILAKLLIYCKKMAEKFLKLASGTINKAVITVPAYFNDGQRQATIDAGTIAGLDDMTILNEPTAAAIAYSLERLDNERRMILIYDLDCECFNVTVLNVEAGKIDVLGFNGDDFDKKLTEANFKKSIDLVDKTLKDLGLRKEEIDDVVLVGGSTRITKVQEMLKDYFGKALNCSIHPDYVVAYGAAVKAAQMNGEQAKGVIDFTKVQDVVPMSQNEYVVVLNNSKVPPRRDATASVDVEDVGVDKQDDRNFQVKFEEIRKEVIASHNKEMNRILDGDVYSLQQLKDVHAALVQKSLEAFSSAFAQTGGNAICEKVEEELTALELFLAGEFPKYKEKNSEKTKKINAVIQKIFQASKTSYTEAIEKVLANAPDGLEHYELKRKHEEKVIEVVTLLKIELRNKLKVENEKELDALRLYADDYFKEVVKANDEHIRKRKERKERERERRQREKQEKRDRWEREVGRKHEAERRPLERLEAEKKAKNAARPSTSKPGFLVAPKTSTHPTSSSLASTIFSAEFFKGASTVNEKNTQKRKDRERQQQRPKQKQGDSDHREKEASQRRLEAERKRLEDEEKAKRAALTLKINSSIAPILPLSSSSPAIENNLPPLVFQLESKTIRMGMCVNGKPTILKNSSGEDSTPFLVVLGKDSQFLYGTEALATKQSGDFLKHWWLFEYFLSGETPYFEKFAFPDGDEHEVNVEFLLGFILSRLKEQVERDQNGKCSSTIITVPFTFTSSPRLQVKHGAIIAGFTQVHLVNEVSALANYHARNDQRRTSVKHFVVMTEKNDIIEAFVYANNFNINGFKKLALVSHSGSYCLGEADGYLDSILKTAKKGKDWILGQNPNNQLELVRSVCKEALLGGESFSTRQYYYENEKPTEFCFSSKSDLWSLLLEEVGKSYTPLVFKMADVVALNGACMLKDCKEIRDLVAFDMIRLCAGLHATKLHWRTAPLPDNAIKLSCMLPSCHRKGEYYQEAFGSKIPIGNITIQNVQRGWSAVPHFYINNEGIAEFRSVELFTQSGMHKGSLSLKNFVWKSLNLSDDYLALLQSLLESLPKDNRNDERAEARRQLLELCEMMNGKFHVGIYKIRTSTAKEAFQKKISEATNFAQHPKVTLDQLQQQKKTLQEWDEKYHK